MAHANYKRIVRILDRPPAFRFNVEHYFPLMEEEKQFLLKLYPPNWK